MTKKNIKIDFVIIPVLLVNIFLICTQDQIFANFSLALSLSPLSPRAKFSLFSKFFIVCLVDLYQQKEVKLNHRIEMSGAS